ncbi:MAG: methylated-DNA--[protein]-cysteine S-methyltransferase [Nitrospirae bacterium]|nr:methylated-DNA--[protein]-cysteine S-methyltransferase [Nitrospirota bacterium]
MKYQKSIGNQAYDVLESPIGRIYLVFSSDSLTDVSFNRPAGIARKKSAASSFVKKELMEYLEGHRLEFTCKTIFIEGTEFERGVWEALREIPYGETRSYKWLAERTGHPHASRAVGNALGKNPIPIIFPCHRVIESDGSIGGYSLGIDIKGRLLKIEYYNKLLKGGESGQSL